MATKAASSEYCIISFLVPRVSLSGLPNYMWWVIDRNEATEAATPPMKQTPGLYNSHEQPPSPFSLSLSLSYYYYLLTYYPSISDRY